LTRALPALALPARCARPKSLPAILRLGPSRPSPCRRAARVQNRSRRFCRTLEHLLGCYSLSRRAPSTTRPPLRAAARVPEVLQAIKSSCWPPCWAAPACSAAGRQDRRPSGPAAAVQARPKE